jgi:hypothetical protein
MRRSLEARYFYLNNVAIAATTIPGRAGFWTILHRRQRAAQPKTKVPVRSSTSGNFSMTRLSGVKR